MSRVTNSPLHRLQVRRNGKQDGRLAIPTASDTNASPFEQELCERGLQHVYQIDSKYAQRINATKAMRETAIAELDFATARYEDTMCKYADHWSGRDPCMHVSRGKYITLFVLMGLGEGLLNMKAFEVFGSNPIETAMVALAVVVGLPLVAHFVGLWLRQWPRPTWRTLLLVLLAVGVVVGGLYGINMARADWLADIRNLEKGAIRSLEYAFMMINLLIFSSAVWLSYWRHDEDPYLADLYERARSLEHTMDRMDCGLEALGGQVDQLEMRRHAEAESINATIMQLVEMYRRENLRQRQQGDRPALFSARPSSLKSVQFTAVQPSTPHDVIADIHERRKGALSACDKRRTSQVASELMVPKQGRKALAQAD